MNWKSCFQNNRFLVKGYLLLKIYYEKSNQINRIRTNKFNKKGY